VYITLCDIKTTVTGCLSLAGRGLVTAQPGHGVTWVNLVMSLVKCVVSVDDVVKV